MDEGVSVGRILLETAAREPRREVKKARNGLDWEATGDGDRFAHGSYLLDRVEVLVVSFC